MTGELGKWVESAREAPELFLSTWVSARAVCDAVRADQRKAGEPESDDESIADAILAAVEPALGKERGKEPAA